MPNFSNFLELLLKLTVANYIKRLLSIEEYSFSLEEIIDAIGKTEISAKSELSRLIEKNEITSLRKGFYLIITPRYSSSGKLPTQLYSEKLFKYLERKYYLGLYTAAKIHGAGHQQAQRDYIMIERPKLNDIKKTNYDIRFLTTSHWPKKNILTKKADAGYYNISSPALTIVDLIQHQTKLGGMNRILTIIEELTEELAESDLKSLLSWYPNRSTIQRLGYILSYIGVDWNYLGQISDHIMSNKYYPVLLCPMSNQKPGAVDNEWKVDVNFNLESDL